MTEYATYSVKRKPFTVPRGRGYRDGSDLENMDARIIPLEAESSQPVPTHRPRKSSRHTNYWDPAIELAPERYYYGSYASPKVRVAFMPQSHPAYLPAENSHSVSSSTGNLRPHYYPKSYHHSVRPESHHSNLSNHQLQWAPNLNNRYDSTTRQGTRQHQSTIDENSTQYSMFCNAIQALINFPLEVLNNGEKRLLIASIEILIILAIINLGLRLIDMFENTVPFILFLCFAGYLFFGTINNSRR